MTRSNFFARADAADARQKTVLEDYLLNPAPGTAELDTFAGLYPNANYMVSDNLLTHIQTQAHDTLVRRDRDALVAVAGWLADPRFQNLQPQLRIIKNRLENFVNREAVGK